MSKLSLFLVYFVAILGSAFAKPNNAPAFAIANLTDPIKLASLKGDRAANPD